MTAFLRCVALILMASFGSTTTAQDACTTNQWVRLSEAGRLTGEVVMPDGSDQVKAISRAELALVDSDGNVLKGSTNSKGRFTIREVEPGIYSLAAARDGFLAVMAVHVLAADQSRAEDFPTRLTVSVTELGMGTVRSAMSRYLSGASSIRPVRDAFDQIDYEAVGKIVCSDHAYRVIRSDAGLAGRTFVPGVLKNQLQPAANVNVMVFRNGDELARTVTDNTGAFQIEGLEPGTYGLMAAGTRGFAVMGFELVPQNPATESDQVSQFVTPGTTLVNQLSSPAATFGMQLTDATGAQQAMQTASDSDPQPTTEDETAAEPISPMAGLSVPPGSYVGGGGAAGGGGNVAGGGLGGVAGLAGAGAILAATLGDDDDLTVTPPAATSPSNPTP